MQSRNAGAKSDLAPTPSPGGVSEINVTPFIDVLLVLFVVFLVAFGFSRRSLPVELPIRHPGLSTGQQMVLALTNDGRYLLNGQPVPRADLPAMLAVAFRDRPVKLLFIRTGSERTYQEFIEAADLARGAGVLMVADMGARP